MKRTIILLLAALLMWQCIPALTEIIVPSKITDYTGLPDIPDTKNFAALTTKEAENFIYITLSKAVESLSANWLGYNEEPELLAVGEDLKASVCTLGHKYQLGTRWVNSYDWLILEESMRVIPYYSSSVAIEEILREAKSYVNDTFDCFYYDLPRWELYRVSKDGDVLVEVINDLDMGAWGDYPYNEPWGYYWVHQKGEAYAWKQLFHASQGSPDLAYITEQEDAWTVYYSRKGDVRYFCKTLKDVDLFSTGSNGKATVRFEECNTGWFIREVSAEYEDGTNVQAFYSWTGDGSLVFKRVTGK